MLTFPDLIRARIKALCAGWIRSISSSINIFCKFASRRAPYPPAATAPAKSLIYIDSARTWSIMCRWVWGSLKLPFITVLFAPTLFVLKPQLMIYWPAYPITFWEPKLIPAVPVATPLFSSSIFELSLKKTFRKTSSFLLFVSSYFTLL